MSDLREAAEQYTIDSNYFSTVNVHVAMKAFLAGVAWARRQAKKK